jgi:acyl transferase domain-containing protein/NADPH:quinone reductase-like Zn-dependent oxidoreductase
LQGFTNVYIPPTNQIPSTMHDHEATSASESGWSSRCATKQEPIAIVGLACRLPGSCNSPKAFWEFLRKGGVASRVPPETRFHLGTHYDGSRKPGTMASPGGMFIDADPRDMDGSFFRLSKVEATAMDPQQRQLLEVVFEGLENSGVTLDAISGTRVGCFVGSYACDYGDIQARNPENRAAATTVGIGRSMLSNRISHFLNIKGPSMTIDTACSGSLTGVDLANRYLQSGEITGAIVAGCNMYLGPEHVMDAISVNGTASGTGKCHTFDAKADGYIKAEGVNMVYLKRLDAALRDGDAIRGIIRGTASGSDGWTAGIASPSAEAQATTIRQAYANAHISTLEDTQYVECHGTGTRAGDVIEVSGIASVFQGRASTLQPLRIGSVKSNIGHSEPAAGLSGLIKVALSLEEGVIPGNPTFETPNPNIDFERFRLQASRASITWPRPATGVCRAGVNSFGYGGSNVHVIVDHAVNQGRHVSSFLKDDDDIFSEAAVSERPYVLPLSANDSWSLQEYSQALETHLFNPAVRLELRDLAYTLSAKRTAHFHRSYTVITTPVLSTDNLNAGKIRQRPPRVGLIFTGQGAQWPQMGKDLLSAFPAASACVMRLNNVLQSLVDGPAWSLQDMLSLPQASDTYKHPELSQTLTTALQLAILAVLEDCGVSSHGVVGHSSGEIAGAVAAGYLTPETAIKVAYYRGKATSQSSFDIALGMMAVGLSEERIRKYLGNSNTVQVACMNSPESVTLSGERAVLVQMERRIKNDGHFARLLAIDAAYHSVYMGPVGISYRDMLERTCDFASVLELKTTMFSSLTGKMVDSDSLSAEYWEKNMTSPVLFDSALRDLLASSVDILIEIGPSNALAGPVTQIKKSTGMTSVEYFPAWKRGLDAITTFCELAGKLFVTGLPIDLARFNSDNDPRPPRTIIDLPNYRWNHAVKYWQESQASKDWRFRKFIHHDLLGSKNLGVPWEQPIWQKALRVDELPWLKDHKLGEKTVFPASGYVAMAVEAMFQMGKATGLLPTDTGIRGATFHLRDVRFLRAMILEGNGAENHISLSIAPQHGKKIWHEFRIATSTDGRQNLHCQGLISISNKSPNKADHFSLRTLEFATPADEWYKTLREIGYGFGTSFRKQLALETNTGSRNSRSLISLEEPKSTHQQSVYPLHPANMDSCFQAAAGALWQGERSKVDAILVPAVIDDLVIYEKTVSFGTAMAISSARFGVPGRNDDPKSYKSDIDVYDTESRESIIQVKGLSYHRLDPMKSAGDDHVYTCLEWKRDISFGLHHETPSDLDEVLDLIAFKKPAAKVLEVFEASETRSAWLDTSSDRTASSTVHLLVEDSNLEAAKLQYAGRGNVTVAVHEPHAISGGGDIYDVLVVHSREPNDQIALIISKLKRRLQPTAYLVVLHPKPGNGLNRIDAKGNRPSTPDQLLDELRTVTSNTWFPHELADSGSEEISKNRCLFDIIHDQSHLAPQDKKISIVQLRDRKPEVAAISRELSTKAWKVYNTCLSLDHITPRSTVLILCEVFAPLLSNISSMEWEFLQGLVSQKCRILWVTQGSQMAVTNPEKSLIHGLARSIRNEDPEVVFMTLDVATNSTANIVTMVDTILSRLNNVKDPLNTDTEFVERNGIVHIARVTLDEKVNVQEKRNMGEAKPESQSLFTHSSCIRLTSSRPGTFDSLHWSQVSSGDIPLRANEVEVELHAASLNFKDVAIVMGLVPGNERLLGLEGAGTIQRMGSAVTDYHVGQRVLVNRKGSLANRVQFVPLGQCYALPDNMTFDDAATLSTVYSTVLYGLIDLAGTQRGYSVLVHSAAGGVGLAALQVCRYLGARVYATVGSDEKREFLMRNYDIPSAHIFSSRSTDFADELMAATHGRGVDVVLNSLSGEMLHESWRCVADNGVFVDIGKKDILDRASISMEPFNRNASYRAVDMSHECITPEVKAR